MQSPKVGGGTHAGPRVRRWHTHTLYRRLDPGAPHAPSGGDRMSWSRWTALLGFIVLTTLLIATATHAQSSQPILQLTSAPETDVRPSLSPDGLTVAFQSTRGAGDRYHIWIMDANGKNQKQLTDGPLDERHPFWSPDGQTIAYDVKDAGAREIWVMKRDGGQKQQLTQLGADSHFPAFSPDGRQLSFYVYRDGILSLWMMNADGSNQRPLVPTLADQRLGQCTFACHQALFSPDGTRISYTGGDHRSVYVMNVDGSDQILIPKLDSKEHQHFPWWLPDGQLGYIVETVTNAEAYTDAWVIQLPNGTPQLLMGRRAQQGPLQWTPDTARIFFHSPRSGNFDIYTIDLAVPGGIEALQGTLKAAGAEHPTDLPGGPGAPRPGDTTTTTTPTDAAPTAPGRFAIPVWVWLLSGIALLVVLILAAALFLFVAVIERRRRRAAR
jgi:Tol biopolymer transport system component